MKIELTWPEFKQRCILDKELNYQYLEANNRYRIFACENGIEYCTYIAVEIPKNSEQIDFEVNYLSEANQLITHNINIVGNISADIPRFSPRLYQNIIDNEVGINVEKTIIDISENGQFDFISISLERKEWAVILEVDGVEVYRISIEELSDKHKLRNTVDFIYTKGNSTFVEKYPTPVDFLTGVKIKVKNLSNSVRKVRAVLLRYKVKVA